MAGGASLSKLERIARRLSPPRIGGVLIEERGGVGDEVAALDPYHDTGSGR